MPTIWPPSPRPSTRSWRATSCPPSSSPSTPWPGRAWASLLSSRTTLLTQFYITRSRLQDGQPLFARILAEYPITDAYVPSGDELFLSHAVDRMADLGGPGLLLSGCTPRTDLPDPPFAGDQIRPARPDDIPAILAASGDFFDQLADAHRPGGDLCPGRWRANSWAWASSSGGDCCRRRPASACSPWRPSANRGWAASILRHLKAHCLAHGKAPLAGCWVGNHASKRTLEAAGMVTKTRLFRVTF